MTTTTSAPAASSIERMPVYYLSHGGGPWPWMPQMAGQYAQLAASLADIPRQLPRTPKAILMVSAHWEEPAFTVQAAAQPGMIYDYGGFPPETYQIHYRSPGSPALAQRVTDLLQQAGIAVDVDAERGYDHGMFSPMQAIYPDASVPVVQLSLKSGLDPAEHLALGRALAPLRGEDVLIIGSGLSYHNLRAFGPQAQAPAKAFDDWLADTMLQTPPAQRSQRLIDWEAAPAARMAHPREEHLLPLMVAVGAAESEHAVRIYHEDAFMGGLAVSSYRLDA